MRALTAVYAAIAGYRSYIGAKIAGYFVLGDNSLTFSSQITVLFLDRIR